LREIRLTGSESFSASSIQGAIDRLPPDGGRVILPAVELYLDRGLELRSNTELIGQGKSTILRKAEGRVYRLSGYHNYGMLDAPLVDTRGLEPGMTVAIRDDEHKGFYETFSRITWVDDGRVGLETGLEADYAAELNPVLFTGFPLIFGIDVENVSVRNLALDGNRAEQPEEIGACRGAAVYFLRSRNVRVRGVEERCFKGEGLGFQMCSDVRISGCSFRENSGNGYHPGAGSTATLFEECVSEGNGSAGLFYCVRANHITVSRCNFSGNSGSGVSIGTSDSHNLIQGCTIEGNGGPGILFRRTERPVEASECRVEGCLIGRNAAKTGSGQIEILGETHDVSLERNDIVGSGEGERSGVFIGPSASRIHLGDNGFRRCHKRVEGNLEALVAETPHISCGMDSAQSHHFRHLVRGL